MQFKTNAHLEKCCLVFEDLKNKFIPVVPFHPKKELEDILIKSILKTHTCPLPTDFIVQTNYLLQDKVLQHFLTPSYYA